MKPEKAAELEKIIKASPFQIPAHLTLHCLNPAVSHVFYSKYLSEPDKFKRDNMTPVSEIKRNIIISFVKIND